MKDKIQPGFDKNTSLGVRMKLYETSNEHMLIPRIPVYVRLDGRAFHTFCRGLNKPFDLDFSNIMKCVTKHLHQHTNAMLSFCQSDEISLVFESPEKMPFDRRLFKIQSVLAGMASSALSLFGLQSGINRLSDRIIKYIPHFDCRVCQMPLEECANMILWRSQDSVKNSITQLALSHFSDKEIHKKNSQDKIEMLKQKGIDYYIVVPEDLRLGAFFRREVYDKVLSNDELLKMPEKQRKVGSDGKMHVTRSHIAQFYLGVPLHQIVNKVGVLFNSEQPILKMV